MWERARTLEEDKPYSGHLIEKAIIEKWKKCYDGVLNKPLTWSKNNRIVY